MKRLFALVLVLVLLLAGCGRYGQQQPQIPQTQTGSVQDRVEPAREAGSLTLETSQVEPEPILPEPPAPAAEPAQPEPEPAEEPAPQPQQTDVPDLQQAGGETEPPAEEAELLFHEDRQEGETYYAAIQIQPAVDVELFEAELLRLINEERQQNGVEPLGLEENLRWAARIRAPETLASLSHTRPDGTPYYTAFDQAGFAYAGKWHGENVSSMYFTQGIYDTVGAAAEMFAQLKGSAGHYSNMLSENFSQIGIGVYAVDDGDTITIGSTQLFASL